MYLRSRLADSTPGVSPHGVTPAPSGSVSSCGFTPKPAVQLLFTPKLHPRVNVSPRVAAARPGALLVPQHAHKVYKRHSLRGEAAGSCLRLCWKAPGWEHLPAALLPGGLRRNPAPLIAASGSRRPGGESPAPPGADLTPLRGEIGSKNG